MIDASYSQQQIAALAKRLVTRAGDLAARRGARLARSRREQGHRWRSADALWPGFGKEQR